MKNIRDGASRSAQVNFKTYIFLVNKFYAGSKWHDTSSERPYCTSRQFLWVDVKSSELVRAVFHLLDAVKGDLMRVEAVGKTYILNCHVLARNDDIPNDYVYLSL